MLIELMLYSEKMKTGKPRGIIRTAYIIGKNELRLMADMLRESREFNAELRKALYEDCAGRLLRTKRRLKESNGKSA